jgi:hypothetical protein
VEGLSVKCAPSCCFSISTVWCDDGKNNGSGHVGAKIKRSVLLALLLFIVCVYTSHLNTFF